MKVEYQPSFIKDLKALKSTIIFPHIKKIVFEEVPSLQFREVTNLKKLKADSIAYRIRVGDYRIGFILKEDSVIFRKGFTS